MNRVTSNAGSSRQHRWIESLAQLNRVTNNRVIEQQYVDDLRIGNPSGWPDPGVTALRKVPEHVESLMEGLSRRLFSRMPGT